MTITMNDLLRIREMLAAPAPVPTCDKRCPHHDCEFAKACEARVTADAALAREMIEPMLEALLQAWADNEKAKNARVPTEIFCPLCNTKHVDQGEWAHEIAHRKHLCAQCGHVWAPYDVGTVGAAFGHATLPVAEHIAVLERDLAWTQSEWGTAGEAIVNLEARRDELLALIAKLSQSVPLESEVSEALNQRGVMLAEIGTLKATIKAQEQQLRHELTAQQFLEDVLHGIGPFVPRATTRTVGGIIKAVKQMHEAIKELQCAVHTACERATTHLPEDREAILEAHKLAHKDYFA